METRDAAYLAARTLDSKKAKDITIIDISEKSGFADYFVIASASNLRQLDSLRAEVEDRLAEAGTDIRNVEGRGDSGWVLIDCGDIIINIFTPEQRDRYQIEKVWRDCARLDFEPEND